ncbi:hypothetical protein EC973_004066 [Apophysomyces ossiformis]|uniref:PAS domain-containing protein n=1 Tax=Apophysomyces ossiformis TaxID=679940 RepID=A0A8H7BGG5_9FUNG|nr:hypothetical protein EC973_004066 [Apophysomyces ossiformis]
MESDPPFPQDFLFNLSPDFTTRLNEYQDSTAEFATDLPLSSSLSIPASITSTTMIHHPSDEGINCKKSHLACDVSRPCKRCVSLGKADTCQDVKHKKRGRPKRSGQSSSMAVQSSDEQNLSTIRAPTFTMTTMSVRPGNAPRSLPSTFAFIHESIGNADKKTECERDKSPNMQLPQASTTLLHQHSATTAAIPLRDQTFDANGEADSARTITVVLSMEACCARISDKVMDMWGYYPQELAHRSFYDFISSEDADRLARLHRLLLDNVTSVVKRSHPSLEHQQPPSALRTTSDLFHDTDFRILAIVASGSGRFSDTLHVKKRAGDVELYDISMSLGGGLGADLSLASDLSKLYIIAEMKKHQYKVSQETSHEQNDRLTREAPKQIAIAVSRSDDTKSHYAHRMNASDDRALSNIVKRPAFGARRQALSLPNSPKINVAPTTGQANHSRARTSFGRGIYRPTSANTIISGASAGRVPVLREEIHNPYSTMAYRSIPTSPRNRLSMFTHPSEQYYLQTSSSTLNAEASAIVLQKRGISAGLAIMMTDGDRAVSSRKAEEMSIRSLLS